MLLVLLFLVYDGIDGGAPKVVVLVGGGNVVGAPSVVLVVGGNVGDAPSVNTVNQYLSICLCKCLYLSLPLYEFPLHSWRYNVSIYHCKPMRVCVCVCPIVCLYIPLPLFLSHYTHTAIMFLFTHVKQSVCVCVLVYVCPIVCLSVCLSVCLPLPLFYLFSIIHIQT